MLLQLPALPSHNVLYDCLYRWWLHVNYTPSNCIHTRPQRSWHTEGHLEHTPQASSCMAMSLSTLQTMSSKRTQNPLSCCAYGMPCKRWWHASMAHDGRECTPCGLILRPRTPHEAHSSCEHSRWPSWSMIIIARRCRDGPQRGDR